MFCLCCCSFIETKGTRAACGGAACSTSCLTGASSPDGLERGRGERTLCFFIFSFLIFSEDLEDSQWHCRISNTGRGFSWGGGGETWDKRGREGGGKGVAAGRRQATFYTWLFVFFSFFFIPRRCHVVLRFFHSQGNVTFLIFVNQRSILYSTLFLLDLFALRHPPGMNSADRGNALLDVPYHNNV